MTFRQFTRMTLDREFDRETRAPFYHVKCYRCGVYFDFDSEDEAMTYMDTHNCWDDDDE